MKMGKKGRWKRWMISLSDEGILEIFDSLNLPQKSKDLKFSNCAGNYNKIFDVEPTFGRLADFSPAKDFYLILFPQKDEKRNLTFWHEGDVYQWPIRNVKGNFKLSEEDGFPSLSDLITFYQLNALPIPPHCKLGAPLTQSHRDFFQLQEWYLPHVNEQETIQ